MENELEFKDTRLVEPEQEEFFDTSEKILKLSDSLAEEIVLNNIKEQIDEPMETIGTRINYVSLFREKYSQITPDTDCYDEEYLKEAMARLGDVLRTCIEGKYGVELGDDLEYTTPAEYLKDWETLYEFLFVRQYENLVEYLKHNLYKNKSAFIEMYSDEMESDEHAKDLFVMQAKKKFKNKDDVLIMHFMNEILGDIISATNSAYELFKEIVDYDKYEEINDRMSELLINYGNKIVLNDDAGSAKLYMKPLEDRTLFAEVRNAVLIDYLDRCEVNE